MARCSPILFVLLALIPLYCALDCRKFSFAPACRGIMLKRSGAHQIVDTEAKEMEMAEKLKKEEILMRIWNAIQEEGASKDGCVNIHWLKAKLLEPDFESF
ncbi:unnamed protein product [Caenorhabditis bovis]|uniref:Uncharacterized protein n=1 Tax=Caenorhabditis bovis TaxID=2654633 RepID=A0A8S1EGL0_9PELO|nr:unnamed protein product [Caenorhabditis bovis]